jgi:hypothetical protein
MSVGAGGPKLPPQVVDLERHTAGAPPLRRRTRWISYAVLGLMAIGVLAAVAWAFLRE